jgi:hypothetical protein
MLTACGYPITGQNLVERFCGMSDPEMLEIIQREWGRALPTSYAEHVGLRIEAGFRQSLAPIKGVVEALDSLKLPICVASSSRLEQIRQKLKITGLIRCPTPSVMLADPPVRRRSAFRSRRRTPASPPARSRCSRVRPRHASRGAVFEDPQISHIGVDDIKDLAPSALSAQSVHSGPSL